jgi:26S proteasome regulatory subunit N1
MYSSTLKKQLAFLLARQGVHIEVEDEELNKILSNSLVSEHFLNLAKQLDVLEAKTPEDIYKSHLENISKRNVFIVLIAH